MTIGADNHELMVATRAMRAQHCVYACSIAGSHD